MPRDSWRYLLLSEIQIPFQEKRIHIHPLLPGSTYATNRLNEPPVGKTLDRCADALTCSQIRPPDCFKAYFKGFRAQYNFVKNDTRSHRSSAGEYVHKSAGGLRLRWVPCHRRTPYLPTDVSEIPKTPYDCYNRVDLPRLYKPMQLVANVSRLDHKGAPVIMIMPL